MRVMRFEISKLLKHTNLQPRYLELKRNKQQPAWSRLLEFIIYFGVVRYFIVKISIHITNHLKMKLIVQIVLGFGVAMLMTSFQTTPVETTYSLTVKVDGLRNSKGVVQFALYNKDGTIPDENFESYYKIGTSPIENGSSTFIFSNLPTGRYAINILHDENENGKIDKGFFLPVEGVGFSNYESIGLSNRPKFSKASFQLNENSIKQVTIIYF